jgi:hypothetical protein
MSHQSIDPHAVLQAFCAQFATQAQAASALGISASYLTDLLKKRREFSDAVLGKLGLTTIVVKEHS